MLLPYTPLRGPLGFVPLPPLFLAALLSSSSGMSLQLRWRRKSFTGVSSIDEGRRCYCSSVRSSRTARSVLHAIMRIAAPQRIDLVDAAQERRPAATGLDERGRSRGRYDDGRGRVGLLGLLAPDPPLAIGVPAIVPLRDLSLVGDVGEHTGQPLSFIFSIPDLPQPWPLFAVPRNCRSIPGGVHCSRPGLLPSC